MTSKIQTRDLFRKLNLSSLYGKFMTEPTTTATSRFKKKRQLTVSTIKFEAEKPVYVKIIGPIERGKQRGEPKKNPDGSPQDPPLLARIINLDTGEEMGMILAKILETELRESYPDESYVGKGFEITKQKRKEGRRYDPYSIAEIELPDEQTTKVVDMKTAGSSAKK